MTKIEWTHRPGTVPVAWNPVTGCTPISPGCAHCYARRMAKRLAGRCGYPESPHEFDVTLHEDRLLQPYGYKKPRTVFVCSMGDLFHDAVPETFQMAVWGIMAASPNHTFIVLTKRAQLMRFRMERYILQLHGTLPNVWLGVTAENQEMADKRIPALLSVPAEVRFVSIEPMLGPVDLSRWLWRCECGAQPIDDSGGWRWNGERWQHHHGYPIGHIDCEPTGELSWAICGGETGPGARPMYPDWARLVRAQCQAAGVPFFFKNEGGTRRGSDYLDGQQYHEWPETK